jgi:excisionase family DNA binding protein
MKRLKPLLDVNETARLLHLKVSTLRSWILKKKIPYCKVGRCIRFRRADIEALISDSLIPASGVKLS